jgi:hypothetical protein
MGYIQRHHHGFVTHFGNFDPGGRRNRGFPNSALTGKEYDSHCGAPMKLLKQYSSLWLSNKDADVIFAVSFSIRGRIQFILQILSNIESLK